MANEHIGLFQSIGLGKEIAPGTPVAATVWIPKQSGSLAPGFDKAVDDSAYGVIDEVFDSQTTKFKTEATIAGILRDDWFGNLLNAAMGTHDLVVIMTLTGAVGGTPARGDSISSVLGGWSGTIKKIVDVGGVLYHCVTTDGGVIDAQADVTDGTWTVATNVLQTGAEGHFFSRLNTNAHPSYTLYQSDPIDVERAPYCMLDTLDIEFVVGDFGKFSSTWMGKQLVSNAGIPAYTSDNPFLTKHANVYFAADESGLNAATASEVSRFKISINKNLTDYMAFGSTDVTSIHNQQFTINGDLEAIYNTTTFRDLVANSTKKAVRLEAINNEVSTLNAGVGNDIYPSLYVDMAQLSFEEWSRSEDNNALVTQTMGFSGEYKNADLATIEILLINGNAIGY